MNGIDEIVSKPFFEHDDEMLNDMAFRELRPRNRGRMKDFILKSKGRFKRPPNRVQTGNL